MTASGAPVGRLTVCPTPIGNLADITLRALEELAAADVIACEDTRRTRVLLDRHGIEAQRSSASTSTTKPPARASWRSGSRAGARVALVSDAGMPLVSDPGHELLREVPRARGCRSRCCPERARPSTALVASGLPGARWRFAGFLPRKRGELRELLAGARETLVAYESPRRLPATLALLAEIDPARPVAVCRELTKLHEEVVRGTAAEVAARFGSGEVRGEVTLVLGAAAAAQARRSGGGAGSAARAGRGGRPAPPRGGRARQAHRDRRQRALPRAHGGPPSSLGAAPMSFYVTTPIYYVNAAPHLGHAYTTIAADVMARHHRQRGEPVFFLTGTDEHGEPVADAAHALGLEPQELADRNAERFRALAPQLGASNDFFIRTTDPEHEAVVQRVLSQVRENGYVYEGTYEGWYCPRCADFKAENEIDEGNRCPIHHIELTREQEDNYFFKLSAFQERLEELYAAAPGLRRARVPATTRRCRSSAPACATCR